MQPLIHVFSRRLRLGEHFRLFTVDMDPRVGWRVVDEEDAASIRQRTFDDWHRVERAIARFAFEASRLLREGWQEA